MNQHTFFIVVIIIMLVVLSNYNVICSSPLNYTVISVLSVLGIWYAWNIDVLG
jgi:hypothetical protein